MFNRNSVTLKPELLQPKSSVCLCHARYLGIVEYGKAWRLQNEAVNARLANEVPDTILFLEHLPVMTVGVSGNHNNIIVPQSVLESQGINVFNIDRGGDVTFHNPGQLVGYFIFDLMPLCPDLHGFIRHLEESIIRTVADFSIKAGRRHGYPGVWVGEDKICAIGLRVTKWVTNHGFALNVNNDLTGFSYINPCGLIDKGTTSISQLLGYTVPISDVILSLTEHCSDVFNIEVRLEY